MIRRPRNPIIPGSKTERTGTSGILRRAAAEINLRFAALEKDVLAAFDRIAVYALNDAARPVVYGMTPEQMQALAGELQASLDAWIAAGDRYAPGFWWDRYITEASQLGTAQSVANIAGLSQAYETSRTLQQAIFSEPYRTRVALGQVKSYEHWSGQSSEIRADLAQIIGSAVADGRRPDTVRSLIRDKLGVSKSKAKQMAQTDITDTLRQARMAEADYAAEEFGLAIGLLWTSALLPTTRHTHAARNGKVYTSAEVREFYSKDGNRYNCHCATTECLLGDDGAPILTDRLKRQMAQERAEWEAARGKAS